MDRSKSRSALLLLGAALLIAGSASAQFNNQWVEFEKDQSAISSGTISNSSNETDMAWGDLDQDGVGDVTNSHLDWGYLRNHICLACIMNLSHYCLR